MVVGSSAGGSEIPHADELVGFVDASCGGDSAAIDDARSALAAVTDDATVIDAAAVIANFEMMTRIADGTGTTQPEGRMDQLRDLTSEFGIDQFQSARTAV